MIRCAQYFRLMPIWIGVIAIVLGLAVFPTAAIADQHRGLPEHAKWIKAVKAAGIFFNQKYRYEHVDDDNAAKHADNAAKHANVNTVRTGLGYRSDIHHGISGLVELDNVAVIGPADYNSTTNGRGLRDSGGSGDDGIKAGQSRFPLVARYPCNRWPAAHYLRQSTLHRRN